MTPRKRGTYGWPVYGGGGFTGGGGSGGGGIRKAVIFTLSTSTVPDESCKPMQS
jgi:hypothetical protein